jgi:16S rRNA (adenine1518-N6/adenine1519-N6)-dimethyltransferase
MALAGGHRARKRLGQHFLHDRTVIARILQALAPRPGDQVLEIGPGLGALTGPLLEICSELDVVELDRDLAAALEQRPEARAGRLRVHLADALRFDLGSLGRGHLRVVGNLPYNISTPLLFHLLAQADRIRDMLFMLQREVVDRLAAAPGTGDYGRLGVMVQYRCRVERLFTVGRGAFTPPPAVESAVVRLTPWTTPPVAVADPALFAETVRRAFAQRRKQLRNALRGWVDAAGFARAGIDPSARAEDLSLAQLAALSESAAPNRA